MPTDQKTHRLRFITVSALVGLLVILGLALAARLLLPHLLAGKIRARLAAWPYGHVAFQHLEVELLPRPGLRLERCTATLLQNIHISAAEVSIVPSMSALLGGRFEPLQVVVERVVLQDPLPLAWPLPAKGKSPSGASWRQIMAEVRKVAPHLVVMIKDSQGSFQGASQTAKLNFDELEVTADLGALQLDMHCRSNLWRKLQVQMNLDENGSIHVAMEGTQLGRMGSWMPTPMDVRFVDGRGQFDLTAQMREGAVDSVALAAEVPWLTIERRGREQRLDQLVARGRVQFEGAHWIMALESFTSARPALQLSTAEIRLDRQEGPDPLVGVDLMVKQASLDALRNILLGMAGDISMVKKAANIIEGGVVHDVHLQTAAPTPFSQIARLENWRMSGRLDGLRLRCFDLPRPVNIQRGQMIYAQHRLTLRHVDLQTGDNQLREIDLALGWRGKLQLEGTVNAADIRAEDLRYLLERIPPLSGHLAQARAQGGLQIRSFRIALPAQGPWQVSAKGRADHVIFNSQELPGSFVFAEGQFETAMGPGQTAVQMQNARLQLLDARMKVTGQLRFAGAMPSHIDVTVSAGHFGTQAQGWLWAALKWPERARPGSAVAVRQGHLQWDDPERFRVQAEMNYAAGPQIALDIRRQGARTEIGRLTAQDKFSHASLAGDWRDRRYNLRFNGNLAGRTLADMFPAMAQPPDGALDGRLQLAVDLDHYERAIFEGRLQVHDWVLPEFKGHRATLKAIAATGDGRKVVLSSGRIELDKQAMDVSGQFEAGSKTLQADLHLQADTLDWQKMRSLFSPTPGPHTGPTASPPAIGGKVRLSVNRFWIHGFGVAPLQADLTMANGNLRLEVQKADLCDLGLPGTLETAPAGQLRVDLQPSADRLSLMAVLQCLFKEKVAVHGTFDLNARLHAQGRPAGLMAGLNGPVDFSATKGRIEKLPLLSKVLAFLNVTEIFAGRLPDLETEGLPYDRFTIEGSVAHGSLEIKSAHLNGPSVEIGSYGTVNLESGQLDLIVVVAPLKTIDRVIKKIPLVDTILGGNLLAVPVRVKGRWDDPRITPLDPGAVGDRLLKMFERTITLPGKLLMWPFETERPAKKEIPPDGR